MDRTQLVPGVAAHDCGLFVEVVAGEARYVRPPSHAESNGGTALGAGVGHRAGHVCADAHVDTCSPRVRECRVDDGQRPADALGVRPDAEADTVRGRGGERDGTWSAADQLDGDRGVRLLADPFEPTRAGAERTVSRSRERRTSMTSRARSAWCWGRRPASATAESPRATPQIARPPLRIWIGAIADATTPGSRVTKLTGPARSLMRVVAQAASHNSPKMSTAMLRCWAYRTRWCRSSGRTDR